MKFDEGLEEAPEGIAEGSDSEEAVSDEATDEGEDKADEGSEEEATDEGESTEA